MSDQERFAEETCRNFLTTTHLKEICRFRGFTPAKEDKESLVSFVAARLLGPTGVAQAMASLEGTYLCVLHLIAMSESPPCVRDLGRVLNPSKGPYAMSDARADFNRVAGGLLNRGVALVSDSGVTNYTGESRFARLALLIPEAHRSFLPPFPVDSEPLGTTGRAQDALSICRRALILAVGNAGVAKPGWPEGLLGRLAAKISFKDGTLSVDGKVAPTVQRLIGLARSLWVKHAAKSDSSKISKEAFNAAGYILSRLPAGHGCSVKALRAGLMRIGIEASEKDMIRFCDDGYQAGFLVCGGTDAAPAYAALSDDPAPDSDGPLAFAAEQRRIRVDLQQTGLGPLLELTAVSQVEIDKGEMRLVPDVIQMGRAGPHFESIPALAEVRAFCSAFEQAARHVQQNHGKTILHEGLVVLRVDDLGLRTQLLHRFDDQIRSLGGPYLAIPRGLSQQVEDFARKEGFAPRRVS
jgi:hypothetical protein